MKNIIAKKGFTLIELLIVIGILAVLATIVLIVINPAQLFAEARDSQRLSDLNSFKNAIAYYLSTASSTSLAIGIMGPLDCSAQCFVYSGGGSNCLGRHPGKTTQAKPSLAIDGTGWVPVPLSNSTGGSPISSEPIDPINTGIHIYSYACDNINKTFQFDAMFESSRYSAGGSDDKTTSDGGASTTVYEVGTAPDLDL